MDIAAKRIEIISDTDYIKVFRLKDSRTGDPVDLTSATNIMIQLIARDRSVLSFNNAVMPARAANYTYAGVLYSAVTPGAAGNTISLVFNGSQSIATVIAAWNTAHSGNTVASNAPDDTVIPVAGSFTLDLGHDSYTPVQVLGSPLIGKIQLSLTRVDTLNLRIGNNQSMKIFIDFGPGGPRRGGAYQSKVDVID